MGAINACATALCLEVANISREDGVSGTSETRSALANLMFDLGQNGHGVKTVVVERLEHLDFSVRAAPLHASS